MTTQQEARIKGAMLDYRVGRPLFQLGLLAEVATFGANEVFKLPPLVSAALFGWYGLTTLLGGVVVVRSRKILQQEGFFIPSVIKALFQPALGKKQRRIGRIV